MTADDTVVGVHWPRCNHRCRLGYSGEPATHWLTDQRDPDPPHVHAPGLAAECGECRR